MVPGGYLLLFASIGILTLATPILGQIPFTQEDLDETLLLIDRDWFETYDGQIRSISDRIEVKVTSDDRALDICDEAASYCQPLQISENAFSRSRRKRQIDQCPNGFPLSCVRTSCTVKSPTQPSDYLVATSDLPPVNSSQLNCGQITSSATADGLTIAIDRVGCSTGASVSVPIRTPIVGGFQDINNSSTVTFKISIAQRPENSTNITFLTIVADGGEVIDRIRLSFLKTGEIYRGEIQTPFGSTTTVANFVDVTTEIEVAIEVYIDSSDAWVQRIYFNGELSLLGYTNQFIRAYRMDLQVDQDNWIMFKDINVYEGVLLDSEIYELATGKAVEYREAPECQCPRSMPNDYELSTPNGERSLNFASSDRILDCLNDIPSEKEITQSRLAAHQSSISSISSIVGNGTEWISRHTNTLEFTIGFNQMMTVYGLVMQTHNIPGTMEIIYQGGVGEDDSLIYIADDCEEAFNMEATIPLKAVRPNIQPQRRKRDVISKSMAKCFNWLNIISSGRDFTFERNITKASIPVFGLEDSHLLDSAAYTAERITVRMSGHRNATDQSEEFYSFISGRNRFQEMEPGIIIHGKPFCNGQPFKFLSPNLTFEGYYSFINEPSSECNCENSPFTGPYCTTCPAEMEGIPSFVSNGECFFCDCSSLSTSPTCNQDTGQCACREDMDETFTGRQCYWYTSSVDPLYGPIAGGTVITVEGYFTSVDLISDLYLRVNRSANREGGAELITEDYSVPYETVSFGLTPQRTEEIDNQGPDLFYNFEYLPNPIIANITPRQMTLSGGTRATVTGQFIDSVAYPRMTVYLRKNGLIVKSLETSCEVINGTMMECETPELTPVYCEIVNCDDIGPRVPTPLPSPSSPTSPTTSFITPTSTTIFTGSPAAARRRKRQTPDIITMQPEGISDNYLNDREGVTFTLGLKFDGLKEYQDLTEHPSATIREQAVIFVFRDPVFDKFPNLNNLETTIAYKGCNPDCVVVAISGDNMEQGAIQSDYIIEVGISKVGVAKLSDNTLTFFPPPEKPGIDPGHNTGNNNPHVRVILGNQKELIGFIQYPADNSVTIGVGVAVGVLVIAALVIGVVCFIRRTKKMQKYKAEKREQDLRYVSAGGGKLAEKEPLFPEIDPDLKAKVERCKIPQEKLQMSQVVGKGNFGRVFRGNLVLPSGKSRVVAVKSLKDSNELSVDELEDFLREATIMIDFQHPNILSLIGVVWEAGDRPLVVLPYMECGDIRKLVKSTDVTLTLGDLLHFCLQVSNGMAYLENQKFVHRDLAARNCMVDSESKVKVADFGLSRDIYEKQYYRIVDQNRPLPIKWMAIEAITQGLFTSKSDVWSFGILCWEILTRGSMPYPAVENYHVRAHVERGERLDQPAGCPDVIFKLLSQCWYENPDDRPSFAQISEFLSTVLQAAGKGAEEKEENYHREYTKDIPQNYLDMSGETADANYIDVLPDNDDYLQPADAISSSNQSADRYIKPSDIPKPSAAAVDDGYAKAEMVQPEAKNESGYMNV